MISSSVGAACAVVPEPAVFCGRSATYAVFDVASYTVTFVSLQTICASPASDCSSSRPPFAFAQRRPVAPVIRADPAWPVSAPEGNSLFVKEIRAVTPAGSAAPSASWIAWASGFGGGVEPLPPRAATATAPATSTATIATESAIRRVVGSVRKIFTAVLSRVPHGEDRRGTLTLS